MQWEYRIKNPIKSIKLSVKVSKLCKLNDTKPLLVKAKYKCEIELSKITTPSQSGEIGL